MSISAETLSNVEHKNNIIVFDLLNKPYMLITSNTCDKILSGQYLICSLEQSFYLIADTFENIKLNTPSRADTRDIILSDRALSQTISLDVKINRLDQSQLFIPSNFHLLKVFFSTREILFDFFLSLSLVCHFVIINNSVLTGLVSEPFRLMTRYFFRVFWRVHNYKKNVFFSEKKLKKVDYPISAYTIEVCCESGRFATYWRLRAGVGSTNPRANVNRLHYTRKKSMPTLLTIIRTEEHPIKPLVLGAAQSAASGLIRLSSCNTNHFNNRVLSGLTGYSLLTCL